MEWYLALAFILVGLVVLIAIGVPIVIAFLAVNVIAMFLLAGTPGLERIILSLFNSVASFILMPGLLFILMGELLFYSGVGSLMINALDKFIGRVPGRLGLLAVGAGVLLATLTGVPEGSTAILGATLTPEMEKRGYKKEMSLGPVMSGGLLASMIPPSLIAVVTASVSRISIGKVLIAIIIPGLLMAFLYAAYIVLRSKLQPSIAPAHDIPSTSFQEKLMTLAKYVLPVGFVIFLVIGIIFIGIATPSEAAATGVVGTFILAAFYRKLTWATTKTAIKNTVSITCMVYIMLAAVITFGEVLAFSGASRGLIETAISMDVSPIVVIIFLQVITIMMGSIMDTLPLIMIIAPLFVPIVLALGFDPVWFVVTMILNAHIGLLTPPFGLCLFIMKGVAPPDTTMGDIYKAAIPFVLLTIVALAIIVFFPAVVLWLPNLMR